MPNTCVQIIRNARLRLGEAPRSIDAKEAKRLTPRRGLPWVGSISAPLHYYADFPRLLRQGRTVWGSLAVANNELFGNGDGNGRAVVVFCPELHVHDDLDRLNEAAQKLVELRDGNSRSDDAKEVRRLLNSNTTWFPPRLLPASITDDQRVRYASAVLARKHVPDRRLRAGCFPILTHPEVESVALLPHDYWPQEMHDYWQSAS